MLRSREQIHRLHLFRAVPLCLQPLGVPGGGGRVAADIDHPLGIHLDNSRKGGFIAAFAGRVEDDDVRAQALSREAGGGSAGVGAEKAALGGDGVAHPSGICLSAFNRFWYDLHTHQLPAVVYHRKADGAHAAVEVQQQVVRGELGILGRDAVELLSGQCVDLIERQGAQPDGDAAEGVFEVARTIQEVGLTAQNDIGVFCVDIQ